MTTSTLTLAAAADALETIHEIAEQVCADRNIARTTIRHHALRAQAIAYVLGTGGCTTDDLRAFVRHLIVGDRRFQPRPRRRAVQP